MTRSQAPHSRSGRWRAAALLVVLAAFAAGCGNTTRNVGSPGPGGGSSTTAPSTTTLPPSTTSPSATTPSTTTSPAGLTSALSASFQAETGALATYRNVVTAFGSVGPFPNVISAEEQHVSTVTALFKRYAIPVPAAAAGQVSPATFTAACSLGVTVEQQIVAMYGDQIPKVAAYPDVTTAFQNLQVAARDNHLPAFEHCS